MRGVADCAPPLVLKAGEMLLPFADMARLDMSQLEHGVVDIVLRDETVHRAHGFDAIEAVMAVKPSAVE